jgi:curved DNA-binding protein CbpA
MKSIGELDHYELLEIPHSATPNEIDRAYRTAQQTYAEGSLALYSLFESQDATTIRANLDEAYRILADPETREAYDREFRFDASDSGPPFAQQQTDSSSGSSSFESDLISSAIPTDSHPDEYRNDAIEEVVEKYDALEDDDVGEFDGLRLRRARLFRGYEIDDIAGVTKVTGAHLRNIEAENFSLLPADVYVRGFVSAYAKTIGLDPKLVVPSYMARVQQSRGDGQRAGFLGRR